MDPDGTFAPTVVVFRKRIAPRGATPPPGEDGVRRAQLFVLDEKADLSRTPHGTQEAVIGQNGIPGLVLVALVNPSNPPFLQRNADLSRMVRGRTPERPALVL